MSTLLYLPFDIHIHIARFLPLRDQLTFATLSINTYKAVNFVFAHVDTLDFTSLLGPPLTPPPNATHLRRTTRLSPSALLEVMSKHVRARTIINLALPPLFMTHHYVQFENLISQMWKENVYRGVGHPNGQLTRILLEKDTCNGAYPYKEFFIMDHFWDRYRYPTEDNTLAVEYNCSPDDTSTIPGWSTVDISKPKQPKILSWYMYRPDFPGDYDNNSCDICADIGTHDMCPKNAPKRLRLDLSVNPSDS